MASPLDLSNRLHHYRLRLRSHSVGHVNVYGLEDDDGSLLLIDAGWDETAVREDLVGQLRGTGHDLQDITGIVVTHFHADHSGLVGWVKEQAGCWVGMHLTDHAEIGHRFGDDSTRYERVATKWCDTVGLPPDLRSIVAAALRFRTERVGDFDLDVPLAGGDLIRHGDWQLEVLHVPGHTPGSLCLVDRDRSILFTGDHVLPTIDAGATARAGAAPDPVGAYLESLAAVEELGGFRAFPGHQDPFEDIGARASSLFERHRRRLRATEAVVSQQGPASAWEVTLEIPRRRSWEALDSGSRVAAVAETFAQLQRLEAEGRVRRSVDRPVLWSENVAR